MCMYFSSDPGQKCTPCSYPVQGNNVYITIYQKLLSVGECPEESHSIPGKSFPLITKRNLLSPLTPPAPVPQVYNTTEVGSTPP